MINANNVQMNELFNGFQAVFYLFYIQVQLFTAMIPSLPWSSPPHLASVARRRRVFCVLSPSHCCKLPEEY